MSFNDHHGHTSGDGIMQEFDKQHSAFAELFNDPAIGARKANVAAGTVLYDADDAANHVHFIHRGQVRLYQVGPEGSQRLVDILGAGDWFGVAALARAEKHGLKAVAVGASVISEVDADQLYLALSHKAEAAKELSQKLAAKVQSARDEAASLIFQDCNARLIQTLIRFSQSAAATPSEDGVVLRITHQQLAQAVGVARETVSLALTQLRHQNMLRTGRNQLMFNPENLKRIRGNPTERVKRVA
jgi:CRP/FNR family transcriptional regulator, cyclic AMP receptor protein